LIGSTPPIAIFPQINERRADSFIDKIPQSAVTGMGIAIPKQSPSFNEPYRQFNFISIVFKNGFDWMKQN
jgi:hypothetical protein